MSATTVAVDLGGTHIRAALVAEDGSVLQIERCQTPVDDPTPAVIPDLVKAVIGRSHDAPAPDKAVVGVAGVVDHEAERLIAAPNLPQQWISNLSEEWLSAAIGLPVSMANDADLAAVGESGFGAGRASRDVVYITISTGVGAGLVVADKLVRGTLSGGEIGHCIIDRVAASNGQPCTVEELGSGTAIERDAAAAGIPERGAALAELVRSGSQPALDIWTAAIEAVGLGIANLAWIVAPQVVVIGGGVGMNHDLVLPIVERQLLEHGPDTAGAISVVTAKLGDSAALAGAAAWWSAVGRD
ncbi:MAG: ROK family protein [Acidimicrobiales bacterium]